DEVVGGVLGEALPDRVCGDPEEVAAYPRVLGLLIDRQRAAGLLNAERQRALHAAVRKAVPDYERDVRDPLRVTWPRLYGGMLRADGVEVTDQHAVRGWLTNYRSRSGRHAALVSAPSAPFGSVGGRVEEGLVRKMWVETTILRRQRVRTINLCTSKAELHLCVQLQRWIGDRLRASIRALK